MSTFAINPAKADDAQQLAGLIYQSGPTNLESVFCGHHRSWTALQKQQCCIDYLSAALQYAEGQFGYANQYISRDQQHIVGCVSYWIRPLSEQFRQHTLRSLVDFFGSQETAQIIQNSIYMAHLVCPPQPNELSLGHLCIAAPYRGRGLVKHLLDFCQQQARQLNKTALCLDVVATNSQAYKVYQGYGFVETGRSLPCENGQALGLQPHCHMQKTV